VMRPALTDGGRIVLPTGFLLYRGWESL